MEVGRTAEVTDRSGAAGRRRVAASRSSVFSIDVGVLRRVAHQLEERRRLEVRQSNSSVILVPPVDLLEPVAPDVAAEVAPRDRRRSRRTRRPRWSSGTGRRASSPCRTSRPRERRSGAESWLACTVPDPSNSWCRDGSGERGRRSVADAASTTMLRRSTRSGASSTETVWRAADGSDMEWSLSWGSMTMSSVSREPQVESRRRPRRTDGRSRAPPGSTRCRGGRRTRIGRRRGVPACFGANGGRLPRLAVGDPIRGQVVPAVDLGAPPAPELGAGSVFEVAVRQTGERGGDQVAAGGGVGRCDVAHDGDVEHRARHRFRRAPHTSCRSVRRRAAK